MQTFSLSCFSSSHRGGGVAPDCMDFCSKSLFPWLQAPFRFRSVRTELCELIYWVLWTTTTTTTTRSAEGSQATRRRRSILNVHLFNSGLYSMWWSFYNQLWLSYFPLAFRLFPFGELIRTLASENKNPTILNMIGFRFIFDARLLILCGN